MYRKGEYMLRISLEYKKKILFVKLEGQLNNKTSYKINNYLIPVLVKQNIQNIVLNITKIDSFDKDGIKAIKNIKKVIKHNKGSLFLNAIDDLNNLKHLHLINIPSDELAFGMVI